MASLINSTKRSKFSKRTHLLLLTSFFCQVRVTDENDNSPVFEQHIYQVRDWLRYFLSRIETYFLALFALCWHSVGPPCELPFLAIFPLQLVHITLSWHPFFFFRPLRQLGLTHPLLKLPDKLRNILSYLYKDRVFTLVHLSTVCRGIFLKTRQPEPRSCLPSRLSQ